MKRLKDIIKEVALIKTAGNLEIPIATLCIDSRTVSENSLFIAIKGTAADGHDFIASAIDKGAPAILCEKLPPDLQPNICYIQVKNSAKALGLLASAFYNHPSQKLKLIGVTGTNGKTTIVTLLYKLFKELKTGVGLLSTIGNYVNEEFYETKNTTPDAITINALLNHMVDKGCTYAFMEVSSHAVVQDRIYGLHFSGGVFTNITHDHLDYHPSFDDYIKAKKQFFDHLPLNAFALINLDDKNGKIMLQNTKAQKYSYALKSMADFKARIMEAHLDGMKLIIQNEEVWVKLIGEFNAYNLLAIYSVAVLLEVSSDQALTLISNMETVAGRLDIVRSPNGIIAVVDYAHTPDALLNVLKTINQIRTKNETFITIVGAGGNRDKAKRPKMAEIACMYSDKVVLTSDNPRFEEPQAILKDMEAGVPMDKKNSVVTIVDRMEAIKTACMMSNPGDIILIAGKGHETYQEVKGVRSHFNDKEIIAEQFMLNHTNLQ